eukprot:GHVS01090477.1.p1 GENE.GHVS01090477.1~~GHVS01090477.1.p1  ORF type:complete len:274 (-),score=24.92 GHVS01090477.1:495-1316(-)
MSNLLDQTIKRHWRHASPLCPQGPQSACAHFYESLASLLRSSAPQPQENNRYVDIELGCPSSSTKAYEPLLHYQKKCSPISPFYPCSSIPSLSDPTLESLKWCRRESIRLSLHDRLSISLCLIARRYICQQLWALAATTCTEVLHLDLTATSRGEHDMESLPATFDRSVKVDQFSAISMRMLSHYELNMLDVGLADYILLHRLSLMTHFTLARRTSKAQQQGYVDISTAPTSGKGFRNPRTVERRWGRTLEEMKRLAEKRSRKKQKPIPQICL